jgi:hypothetical protein
MKPDLGLHYVEQGVSKNVAIMFYDMPFDDVDFVAPNAYLAMFDIPVEGVIYAASLDFSDDIFAHLIARIPADVRKHFGASLTGKRFPFRVALPAPVTLAVVECHLGDKQRGANEEFVPLVITRVE